MSQTEVKFLSPDFLAQYKGKLPGRRGTLFLPVYLRTYSRYLPELKRRERWDETVARVVQYSMELYQGPAPTQELIQEAKDLYHRIFNLEMFPSGRTLWVGGTSSAERFGESQFNCCGCVVDEIDAFGDIFQLLLCGCGVGFSILDDEVAKLPLLVKSVKVIHEPYQTIYPGEQIEDTYWDNSDGVRIMVGDSREGWVKALREFFEFCELYASTDMELEVSFNYNAVRPEGSRINSFGGRAPGPAGLMEMFTNLAQIITDAKGKLAPIDCLDIINYLGKNVVVGGTRRSAQIGLISPENQACVDAKLNMWLLKQNLHRTMSNNTVVFKDKPSRDQLKHIFTNIRNNGEPGFLNYHAATSRRPEFFTINPCGEALLNNKGFCNLSTVNLMAFITEEGMDVERCKEAIRHAVRSACRITNVNISLPKWDKTQKKDRLLGVSLTGFMDLVDHVGRQYLSFSHPLFKKLLQELRATANEEADKYSFEMRIPRPLLVTVLKPEGTLSQLPTVSSGLHRAFAPYFIRRIRVSSIDPVGKALVDLGVPYETDKGKSERLVFSFPIKSGACMSAAEEPARDQFKRYLMFQEHYTDHNSSCTLTIGENEWTEIEDMVYDNWDKVVACAFLPKYTDAYPQMPYEEITKDQYEEMMKTFPNLDELVDLVNKYEQEEYEDGEIGSDCEGGACPVR